MTTKRYDEDFKKSIVFLLLRKSLIHYLISLDSYIKSYM